MFYVLDECIPQTMGWVFASLTEKSSSSARRWSAMYRTPSRARRRHGEKDRLGSDTRLVSFAGRWHRFITCPNCWSSYFRSKGSESDRCRDVADGEEMDVDIPLPNPNSMSWQFSPSTSVSWWSQLLGVLRWVYNGVSDQVLGVSWRASGEWGPGTLNGPNGAFYGCLVNDGAR